MRWLVFAIFVYLALALDHGLAHLLGVQVGNLPRLSPSFVLIVMAFVGIWAPPATVLWAALVAGLLVDLRPLPMFDGITVGPLLGPTTLGYLLGGYAMVQFRGLLYRDSPLAVAALVLAGGAFVHLVAVAILTVRALSFIPGEPIPGWVAADQLVYRFFELLYTTAAAVPLGYLLLKTQWFWGFEISKGMGVRRMG